jgi:uncharacterized repeat protein (TIGR02543 family)
MISDLWTRGNTARVVSKCIISVALMTSVLTVGLESSASAVSVISEAAGFPVAHEAQGVNTLTVNPQHVGDLLIFQSQIHSQGVTITGVTCPETGTWQLAQRYVDGVNGVITEEIWWALATGTGSTTITATYSGDISAIIPGPELVSDSFTSTNPGWSVVSGNGTAASTTTAITFPSVTSGPAASQLYWGYVESTGTASSGATTGFTYTPTAQGNLITSNAGLSPATPYAPTATESPATNNTSIAAIFANAYDTVTFNSQGGSAVGPLSGNFGSTITLPAAPTRAGYVFNGWFAAASGGSAITSPYTLTGSVTLYAQWTANATVTVTFNSQGGSAVSPMSGPNGSAITLPAAPTFAGYVFNGWFAASSGGTALTSPYTLTGSVTLYAQWMVAGGSTLGSLTIAATNLSVTVGDTVSPTAAVTHGLSAGDAGTVVSATFTYAGTGTTVYAASTTPPTAAGTYSVTPSAATLSIVPSADAANYSTTYVYAAGTLVITSKPPVIPPVTAPHASGVIGRVVMGGSRVVTIVGSGFSTNPRVTSNESGAIVHVLHASATRILLWVSVRKRSRPATHTFTITTASGKTCRIGYIAR